MVRRVRVRRSPNHQGRAQHLFSATNDPARKRQPKSTGAAVPDPSASCGPRERTSTCVSPPQIGLPRLQW